MNAVLPEDDGTRIQLIMTGLLLAAAGFPDAIPLVGFAAMIVLPTVFVFALATAILRESRSWAAVSGVLGVGLAVATAVLLQQVSAAG